MSVRWMPPVFAGVAALVLASGTAVAQDRDDSPHGILPPELDCSACHTAVAWQPARDTMEFRHGDRSGFLLTGAHVDEACSSCHTDLRLDGPDVGPDDCAACHTDVHEGDMSDECAACHVTASFSRVSGETIHDRTSFPLTGAHLQITCESCHVDETGGVFSSLETDCVACHEVDYRGARRVDHVANDYPTDCTQCHSTVAWVDAPLFDHAITGFALLGAHDGITCASCHAENGGLLFPPPATQDDCVACHQADYDGEHAGSGFPTTCTSCHSVSTWEDPDFDHTITGFALLGAHDGITCASCHAENGGLLFPEPATQDDCVACHQADYDGEHAGSGFPTTCTSCHSIDTWEGADINHDAQYFRIYSGPHRNEWNTCSDCHTVPTDFGLFTCLSCHEHTKSRTDNDHSEVSGYVYESGQCYACHADE